METDFSWLFPRTFGSFLFLFLNVLGSKMNQRDKPSNSFCKLIGKSERNQERNSRKRKNTNIYVKVNYLRNNHQNCDK